MIILVPPLTENCFEICLNLWFSKSLSSNLADCHSFSHLFLLTKTFIKHEMSISPLSFQKVSFSCFRKSISTIFFRVHSKYKMSIHTETHSFICELRSFRLKLHFPFFLPCFEISYKIYDLKILQKQGRIKRQHIIK